MATERSPYGFDLGVTYPRVTDVDALLAAAGAGVRPWRDAGPDRRTGVCLEILDRLHARIFELANAVQHTSGQAFVMAFQAGGAHALDRALEAIAYAYVEMTRTPPTALWEKPGPKPGSEPLRMEKTFTVVPRGVALVIGCHTFPTLELLARALRLPRHREPRRREAPPWCRPAVGDHGAGVPGGARRGRAAHRPRDPRGRGARGPPGRACWPCGRRCGSSTSPAATPSGSGWRRTPGRPRSSPRRRGSTPS